SIRAAVRRGRKGLQVVRRDPGKVAVRKEVHGYRAQHVPVRPRRQDGARMAQGARQGARRRSARGGEVAVTAAKRTPGKPGKPVSVERRLFVLDTNVLMH